MRVQIVDLPTVPDHALTGGRVTPEDKAHAREIRATTVACFALARNNGEALCVGGLRMTNFLSGRPLMWCAWFEEARASLHELAEGRELLGEWLQAHGTEFEADIPENDTVAQRFAEWLGFEFTRNWRGFKLYKRVV